MTSDRTEPAACRLYLISPERIEHPTLFAEELRAALDGGDVAAFQLRLKDVDDAAIARAADTLRPICQQRDVAFFMNDRPDLAVKLDCDGVHIGQDDMPYAEARRIVGAGRQIGVTCKASRHLAMEAAEAGADYVAFGAFFPSNTKAVTTPADLGIIEWWSGLMEVPCVAIGGITVDNCRAVVEAGADFLAVAGGVWNHKDGPQAAVRAFNKVFGGQ
ncbi:MAG: thiamine phosphate synthase [Alphaproteobacteria bacterium]|nr:thiamine phosphate synthase [Alphaproteobacteria bacterium]